MNLLLLITACLLVVFTVFKVGETSDYQSRGCWSILSIGVVTYIGLQGSFESSEKYLYFSGRLFLVAVLYLLGLYLGVKRRGANQIPTDHQ